MKRRSLPHNEPPVSHDDIADVDLQMRINSPSHTSASDVSLSIEHEHLSQPYSLPDNPLLQDPLMTMTAAHHKLQNYHVVSTQIIVTDHSI